SKDILNVREIVKKTAEKLQDEKAVSSSSLAVELHTAHPELLLSSREETRSVIYLLASVAESGSKEKEKKETPSPLQKLLGEKSWGVLGFELFQEIQKLQQATEKATATTSHVSVAPLRKTYYLSFIPRLQVQSADANANNFPKSPDLSADSSLNASVSSTPKR